MWHKLSIKECNRLRGKKINFENKLFLEKLKKFGYFINIKKKNELKKIINSFQRRYRPELIDGKVDRECFEIMKTLISSK